MTGVFLHAVNTVKNFVFNLPPFAPKEQDPVNGGPPRLYSVNSGGHSSRKRPLERFIEIEREEDHHHHHNHIELTDDEDEVQTTSYSTWKFSQQTTKRTTTTANNNDSKRFKGSSTSAQETLTAAEMEERERIITRGTGLNPAIPGLQRQPWEFNFPSRKGKSSKPPSPPASDLIADKEDPVACTSTSMKSNRHPNSNPVEGNHVVTSRSSHHQASSSSRDNNKTDFFSGFRFSPPKDKEIEVITILDEPDLASNKTMMASSPGGRDVKCSKKKFESLIQNKPKMKQKQTFLSMLGVGRKAVDPISTTFRLEERNLYRDLIAKMNMKQPPSFIGRHLQRSKVEKSDVQALYHNWNQGNSPRVSLSIQRYGSLKHHHHRGGISDRVRNDLRLFSTPAASRSSGSQTPVGPSSPSPPLLVDLEEEIKEKSEQNQIVSYDEAEAVAAAAQASKTRADLSTSFADLDEALLSSTKYGDVDDDEECKNNLSLTEYSSNNSGQEDLVFTPTPTSARDGRRNQQKDEDTDIAILSESILNNYAHRRYNSLALEQNTSPYVNRSWRNNLTTAWHDNKKRRDKEINEHLTTVDVLNKESTLEKDLREDIRRKLTLTEIIVLEEAPPKLPDITEDMKLIISTAQRPGRPDDILTKIFSIDFTRGDVKTLAPCKWLNDNVINAYMELISQRSKQQDGLPNVHAFTTFFYPKLLKEGYSNPLKRWTRKVDIFENDLIVFPIHLGLHWCLACADLRTKSIKYYDSLGGRNDRCLHALLNYLAQEMKERKGQLLNKEEWSLENVDDVPQQQNGSDCGVFTCKFAEYLSRDARLTFLQENMNYYRDRMVYEIIQKDLLYP